MKNVPFVVWLTAGMDTIERFAKVSTPPGYSFSLLTMYT